MPINKDLITEIIDGKWGYGQDRVYTLSGCGYDYDLVQRAVNAYKWAEWIAGDINFPEEENYVDVPIEEEMFI